MLVFFSGIFIAGTTALPAYATTLPSFTANTSTVNAGDTVTITATPGTSNFADICQGQWASADSASSPNLAGFSFVGKFTNDSSPYVGAVWLPSAPSTTTNAQNIQWPSIGWGNFNPTSQSTPFTFTFTVPNDVVTGAYTLKISCISPNFWLRDRLTLVEYPIHFNTTAASSGISSAPASNAINSAPEFTAETLAATGKNLIPLGLGGMLLIFSGISLVSGVIARKRRLN